MITHSHGLLEPIGTPLVVDMDGTLVRADTTHEILFRALIRSPLKTIGLVFKMRRKKTKLKEALLDLVDLTTFNFPLNLKVVSLMDTELARGREVVVATGATLPVALHVTQNLPFRLNGIFTSTSEVNLVGKNKAEVLNRHFGLGSYIYAGNSKQDLHVFRSAASAILVGFKKKKNTDFKVSAELPRISAGRAFWRAGRPWQWSKNFLVFLPMVAGLSAPANSLLSGLIAFVSFSLLASSLYVINDLVDLNSDRLHTEKA